MNSMQKGIINIFYIYSLHCIGVDESDVSDVSDQKPVIAL